MISSVLALDHSQVIGDQTFYFSLSFSRGHSAMTISTAAAATGPPGRARGPSCDGDCMTRVDQRRGSAGETPFLIAIH